MRGARDASDAAIERQLDAVRATTAGERE